MQLSSLKHDIIVCKNFIPFVLENIIIFPQNVTYGNMLLWGTGSQSQEVENTGLICQRENRLQYTSQKSIEMSIL